MAQTVPVRSSKTLNGLGHFTNGCLSSFGMLAVVNPFEKIKTELYNKNRPSFNGAMRGFPIGALALIPSQGTAFATYEAALRYLSPDQEPSEKDKAFATTVVSLPMSLSACPFERIKTIQQLTPDVTIRQAGADILSQEGYRGFMRGLTPTIARKFLYAGGLLNINGSVEKKLPIRHKKARQLLASAATGACVGWLSSPPDRIRVLMQGNRRFRNQSSWAVTRHIIQTESILGLFKGSLARAWQISLSMTLMAQGKEYIPLILPAPFHRRLFGG